MARPHKQTVDYFPHDASASTSKTIFILESKFGNDGYAFWFKLLELLSDSEGHVYDCRNPVAWEFLQAKTHVDDVIACRIMELLVELEAIDKELWSQKLIWVQNLVDNISEVYRNRRSEIPKKPNLNGQHPSADGVSTTDNPSADGVSTTDNPSADGVSTVVSIPPPKISKNSLTPYIISPPPKTIVKESKVKKSRGNKIPSVEENKIEFEEFVESKRGEFPLLDIDKQLTKFSLYWSEGNRKLQRPKSAFQNWLEKAMEFKANGTDKPGGLPKKYGTTEEYRAKRA